VLLAGTPLAGLCSHDDSMLLLLLGRLDVVEAVPSRKRVTVESSAWRGSRARAMPPDCQERLQWPRDQLKRARRGSSDLDVATVQRLFTSVRIHWGGVRRCVAGSLLPELVGSHDQPAGDDHCNPWVSVHVPRETGLLRS
jgi:hypothetical protein